MSQQERDSFIALICNEIQSYQGFTSSEKKFGIENLQTSIDKNGDLNNFIQRYEQLSLDITPFLAEKHLFRV